MYLKSTRLSLCLLALVASSAVLFRLGLSVSAQVPAPAGASAAPGQARPIFNPGAVRGKRRPSLMLLGVILMAGSGFGFWYTLQSFDERQKYVVTTRTIERWEVLTTADLTTVDAHIGNASALMPTQVSAVLGQWATGRIPQGTLITPGMFAQPPLSNPDEADSIVVEIPLPAGELSHGTIESGDKLALIGRESPEGSDPSAAGEWTLITILQIEVVDGGRFFYVLPPSEALALEHIVNRYLQAPERKLWKLGANLSAEDVQAALDEQNARER